MDELPLGFEAALEVYRACRDMMDKDKGPEAWRTAFIAWIDCDPNSYNARVLKLVGEDAAASAMVTKMRSRGDDDDGNGNTLAFAQVASPTPLEVMLPSTLLTDEEFAYIHEAYPEFRDVLTRDAMYRYIADHVLVTRADIVAIANAPQGTQEWLDHRSNRMTGSVYGTAAGVSPYQSPEELTREMIFREEFPMDERGKKACAYGSLHEDDGCDNYEAYMIATRRRHGIFSPFWVEHRGLEVHPRDPWSGDSKDGIVHDGDLPPSLLEIKCPTRALYPKIPPYYYSQVQGIMMWNGHKFCDFCVWRPDETQIERFPLDEDYCYKFLKPMVRWWWFCHFMPHAVLKREGKITHSSQIKPMLRRIPRGVDPDFLKTVYGYEDGRIDGDTMPFWKRKRKREEEKNAAAASLEDDGGDNCPASSVAVVPQSAREGLAQFSLCQPVVLVGDHGSAASSSPPAAPRLGSSCTTDPSWSPQLLSTNQLPFSL
jgi:putative phage-type endonuclease